ncbi:MAG: YceI family protein [Aquabacterium sp.]
MRKSLSVAALTLAGFAPGLVQAQAGTYAIDPTHTFVTFEVPHFATSTNRGRFDKKTGTVQFDRAGRSGKVDISFETVGINTGTPAFDRHLQSKDFFNSAEHPAARFVSERFSFNGDKVSEVAGQLTLLGKTLPVTLKATNFNCFMHGMLKREVCGGDFESTIVRSQWGMTWGLNFGFSDAVRLVIQVEAIRQE